LRRIFLYFKLDDFTKCTAVIHSANGECCECETTLHLIRHTLYKICNSQVIIHPSNNSYVFWKLHHLLILQIRRNLISVY
jgi:hypothetical protein